MYKVRYETLTTSKEFEFANLEMAEAFKKGLLSMKDAINLVTIEIVKGE